MKTIKLKKWGDKIPDNFTGCIECPDGTKYWYLNGKRHRTNGAAVELSNGEKFYYLYDHYLTQEQHQHYVELINMEYEEDVIVWLIKIHKAKYL